MKTHANTPERPPAGPDAHSLLPEWGVVPAFLPVVHLEAEIPLWNGLVVCGAVAHPRRFSLDDLKSLGESSFEAPLVCVWGWSRPNEVWTGVSMQALLDLAGPHGSFATFESASRAYSSCLPLEEAGMGWLVWGRAGSPLPSEHGGPLRFLQPPHLWAYKGVKWVARIEIHDEFRPGFWESRVSDPRGVIPRSEKSDSGPVVPLRERPIPVKDGYDPGGRKQ